MTGTAEVIPFPAKSNPQTCEAKTLVDAVMDRIIYKHMAAMRAELEAYQSRRSKQN